MLHNAQSLDEAAVRSAWQFFLERESEGLSLDELSVRRREPELLTVKQRNSELSRVIISRLGEPRAVHKSSLYLQVQAGARNIWLAQQFAILGR